MVSECLRLRALGGGTQRLVMPSGSLARVESMKQLNALCYTFAQLILIPDY